MNVASGHALCDRLGHIWTRIDPRPGAVCQRCRVPYGCIVGQLSAEQLAWAERRAGDFVDRVISEKLGAGHGEEGRDRETLLRRHRPGAIGEAAVRDALTLPLEDGRENWSGRGDVEGREIRASFHSNAHLIVFPNDPDSRKIVLVVLADLGIYRVCGWLFGREGKKDKFIPPKGKLRSGSPRQWWVPQSELRPAA